jgi:hypothetical protein
MQTSILGELSTAKSSPKIKMEWQNNPEVLREALVRSQQ